jgi:hypothetical protein
MNRASPAGPRPWPFLAWALVGAGCCLALLTPLTIGPFVLPAALAGAGLFLLLRRRPA